MAEQLSQYQNALLEEMKKNPELMEFCKTIFKDYSGIVFEESKLRTAQTNKNKDAYRIASKARMNIEAFIEKRLCALYGIDVDKIAGKGQSIPQEKQVAEESLDNIAKKVSKTKPKKS